MNDYSASPLRQKADRLAEAGKPEEAARLYKRLTEENPDDDSNFLCLAWTLIDCGKRKEAVAALERLLDRELARGLVAGFAFDELLRIYREDGNREALLSVCRRAARVQPKDTGIMQTVGSAFVYASMPSEAIAIFNRLVESSPDTPDLWEALGEALISAGDIPGGKEAYRKAAQTDPSDTATYLDLLARALMRAGYPKEAIVQWKECENAQPTNPTYALSAGECLVHMGKFDAAFDAFGRAATIRPVDAGEFWRRLGDMLAKKGAFSPAERAYKQAVSADPQNIRYKLHLASSLASLGKNKDAAALLELVKARKP